MFFGPYNDAAAGRRAILPAIAERPSYAEIDAVAWTLVRWDRGAEVRAHWSSSELCADSSRKREWGVKERETIGNQATTWGLKIAIVSTVWLVFSRAVFRLSFQFASGGD